ncbi:hypothetical protein UCDDS831_g08375 [Diplodia seriata]|uniref:Uncharacterized protein n=1 Tax=Diplodia seriata TaxID=420778 RepID=A0A0G2GAI6_9PEZI|nr:hypothetical protein UCDDS831_g08375 [Diplodia seriata]
MSRPGPPSKSPIMLNVKRLSDLLAKNVDPKLYPRMFVMSPNGTLLAYSTPANIKELRDQAALISMAWKEHELNIHSGADDADHDGPSAQPKPLETLTIEFDNNNLIVRAIQSKLLLVLVGGVPPARKHTFKITPETQGGLRYPIEVSGLSGGRHDDVIEPSQSPRASGQGPDLVGSPEAPSTASIADSTMSQREKDTKLGALHIQRKKLDAMTRFIRQDFERKGFVMPDDVSFP